MSHAILSASGASRWMNCNPSARLEETVENTTSEYAEEGTLAHALAELKLRKYFIETGMAKKTYTTEYNKLKKHRLWQNEIDSYTDEYVDHIKAIAMSFSTSPYIEIEKKVSFEGYVPEAFGTADTIIISGDRLYILDLKYGKGVPVYAEDNPQLMLYALGAYLEYSLFYDIKHIEMHIVQPRLENISVFSMKTEDLLNWAETVIKPNAQRAFAGEGEFNPGEHCKFCKVKGSCRARAENYFALEELKEKGSLLTNDEKAEALQRGAELDKWLGELKAEIYSAIEKGEEVKGWKIVQGRSAGRKFTDTDVAVGKLKEHGIQEELLFERKMLTVPQMETVIGKKDFKEWVGDMIETIPGKPTLVPESDKREAITKRKAEDVFGKNNI
ncbi:DUF2800 domain-containing protein [Sebaldella sp. S0638]|uniref:DUF2800 domain-containing protein n=1 Tax=Sebaldella sp. S0638 TaxID=2957809 RepID=UPI00209F0D6C|nr:DUF2800 domain-containing protein [Sebaldella sp. S0638]MCP1225701.1 DUF2800 domain-containing protein [Sebaldella sp. S0638]